jgi:hypothetical protein
LPPGYFNIGLTSEDGCAGFKPAQFPGTLIGGRREMTYALLGGFLGSGGLAQAFENLGAQDIIWAGIGLAQYPFINFFQREGKIASTPQV